MQHVALFNLSPIKLCGGGRIEYHRIENWDGFIKQFRLFGLQNGSSSILHNFFLCQLGDSDANNTYLSWIGFMWS